MRVWFMTSVLIGKQAFQVREGPWVDGLAPWNPLGAKQMAGGKVRLTLTRAADGSWRSVGLSGPEILPGKVYTFEVLRRLDQMDPKAVFAAWGHNDINQDEADFVEASRWGDLNSPQVYWGGWFDKGARIEPQTAFPGRAFARHRFTVTTSGGRILTVIEGWWSLNGVWKEVARFSSPFMAGMVWRFAMWLYATGPLFTDATDRGPLSVDLCAFAMADAPTK